MIRCEESEQIALFQWARLSEGKYPELRWLHHIPNGGARHIATGIRLKAAGVKSGVPDICLPAPRGEYHGLYIEMKFGRNGLSVEQKEWLEHLDRAGYKTAVCYGCDEAICVIKKYLAL